MIDSSGVDVVNESAEAGRFVATLSADDTYVAEVSAALAFRGSRYELTVSQRWQNAEDDAQSRGA